MAKKGADEVLSILDHFIATYVGLEVNELHIFCDSCVGQNKNYTVFHYLHRIVASTKRLSQVKVTFPMRGHSYLECDKNMGLINQKARLETPDDWCNHIRKNPKPFVVVKCSQDMFKGFTAFLKPLYKPTCPFPTRPMFAIF